MNLSSLRSQLYHRMKRASFCSLRCSFEWEWVVEWLCWLYCRLGVWRCGAGWDWHPVCAVLPPGPRTDNKAWSCSIHSTAKPRAHAQSLCTSLQPCCFGCVQSLFVQQAVYGGGGGGGGAVGHPFTKVWKKDWWVSTGCDLAEGLEQDVLEIVFACCMKVKDHTVLTVARLYFQVMPYKSWPLLGQVQNGPLLWQIQNGPLLWQIQNGPLLWQIQNRPLVWQIQNGPLLWHTKRAVAVTDTKWAVAVTDTKAGCCCDRHKTGHCCDRYKTSRCCDRYKTGRCCDRYKMGCCCDRYKSRLLLWQIQNGPLLWHTKRAIAVTDTKAGCCCDRYKMDCCCDRHKSRPLLWQIQNGPLLWQIQKQAVAVTDTKAGRCCDRYKTGPWCDRYKSRAHSCCPDALYHHGHRFPFKEKWMYADICAMWHAWWWALLWWDSLSDWRREAGVQVPRGARVEVRGDR